MTPSGIEPATSRLVKHVECSSKIKKNLRYFASSWFYYRKGTQSLPLIITRGHQFNPVHFVTVCRAIFKILLSPVYMLESMKIFRSEHCADIHTVPATALDILIPF